LEDLIKEYKESLRNLQKVKAKKRMEYEMIEDLKIGASRNQRQIGAKVQLEIANDLKIISAMERDLQYALEWMTTARRPGNRRGIERRSAYQRTRLFDPLLVQKYFQAAGGDPYKMIDLEPTDTLTQSEKERLEDALSELTDLEKEYYMLHYGRGFSLAEIGNMFCVAKGTVQTTIERAEKKITERINSSLFCLCR